jgi:hypothetical protein
VSARSLSGRSASSASSSIPSIIFRRTSSAGAHNLLAQGAIPTGVLGAAVEEWMAKPASTPGEFERSERAAA